MEKEMWSILGIPIGVMGLIYFSDLAFLKWVIFSGILGMFGTFVLTRESKISMFASCLVMMFVTVLHYF